MKTASEYNEIFLDFIEKYSFRIIATIIIILFIISCLTELV